MHRFTQNGGQRLAHAALTAASRTRTGHVKTGRALLHTQLLQRPTTTTGLLYPAVHARLQPTPTPTAPRRAPRATRPLAAAPVRHCSHRRTMCRHFGAEGNASIDITKGREVLPANVKPLHYDLTLEPDFEKFTYDGTVTIEYALARLAPLITTPPTPLTPP